MAVSALDSRIFRNLFGTDEMRAIFSDDAYIKRMIEVEAALARAQSKCGVIPLEAGAALSQALSEVKLE